MDIRKVFTFGNFYQRNKYFFFLIREFFIMSRKIIFIIFLTLQMELIVKAVILLFLTFLSLSMILTCKPFVLQDLNILELKSNLSALTILFAGNIYLCDVSDHLKAFCFSGIVIINTWFLWNFLFAIILLFFQINFERFHKFSPRITIICARFLLEIDQFSLKTCFKFQKLKSKNKIKIKKKLKENFLTPLKPLKC